MTKAIEFTAKLVHEPLKVESDNWHETAHRWYVTINGQGFDYYTGVGHRTAILKHKWSEGGGHTYDEPKHKNLTQAGFESMLKLSKAKPPVLDDVLYSLVSDSDATEMSFSEWCSNHGYDSDSRKAMAIYEACQANADKLRKAGINIAAERERLQDY